MAIYYHFSDGGPIKEQLNKIENFLIDKGFQRSSSIMEGIDSIDSFVDGTDKNFFKDKKFQISITKEKIQICLPMKDKNFEQSVLDYIIETFNIISYECDRFPDEYGNPPLVYDDYNLGVQYEQKIRK